MEKRKAVVHVLGLGPGPLDLITMETMGMLEAAREVLVRTSRHPCVEELAARGVRMRFLDRYYESGRSMEEVYAAMAREVAETARTTGEAHYAVPGFALVAERTVQLLLGEGDLEVRLHGAVSFLEPVLAALGVDALEGLLLLDGDRLLTAGHRILDPRVPSLVAQVDSRIKASDVKIELLEAYPSSHPVKVIRAAGTEVQEVEEVPLEELDRAERFDHLTTLYLPAVDEAEIFDFQRLLDVVARLRGPGGCPWDRKQTHQTLARHMVEEAHEAVEAIRLGDMDHLAEELGDLLLQVALHCQLGSEEGAFDIRDTLSLIIAKLLRRHPHVFGDVKLDTAEEVIARWERIKAEERGEPSVLDGVAEGLPALIYAFKLQSRAARVGFDWGKAEEVLPKLGEELAEIEEVLRRGEGDLEGELGDMLFTLVNVCRHYRVDPEVALRRSASKFSRRFREVEERLRAQGRRVEEVSLEELDALWEASKDEAAGGGGKRGAGP
ncbi:MAG: nucleoside triphosphate pyrophosphohydrolase [Actinobacteria bacterium]|nr:nucleoside triphosphate pyrophosphohydrolase [Actinomycetota bacterium]